MEYHNAVIRTVQTTLNAGTVFVTLFPNFNMSLKDPHLCDALKVQVQITGASQVHDTFAAILHYQLAYRLQNHAFDIAIPEIAQSNDALLIQVDPGMTPMCTFVPRQLNKDQMKKLFPESWITKYETLHQASQPIQSNTPFFIRNQNGDVEVRFMTTTPEKEVTVFPTAMIQPVSYESLDGLQIKAFREDGKPVYEGKSSTGHIWWDKRRKKKSSQQLLKERYEAGDPEPLPCYMFDHASPPYSQNFPPFESFDHPQANVKHVWKIKNPVGTNPDGSKKQVSSAEAALNWQAENAVAQNQVLSKILDNQQKLTKAVSHTFSSSNSLIEDLKKKIQSVEQELETIVSTIIAKFVARLTGRLRQWWINLGEYRQRQAAQSNTLDDFFTILHNEFLGSLAHYTEVARDEFLIMKCCSFERKDLEKHFDRMSSRYYAFNGMDDVNSKHTFLNSFPEPLGDETLRMMNLQKITLQQASLGEIYQHVLIALEKLCNQRKKPGHCAKNCPKKAKPAKLLEQAQIHADDTPFSDVESLFSLDDEYSPQALVVMAYSTSEDESDSSITDDSDPEIQTIYTSQPLIAPIIGPTPIAQVHILLDTYSRPIPVIALFDTGAAATILHPKILPEDFWLPHHQMFRAANGETFLITQKSKPIHIRIFPTLTIKHQVLGSPLTGRDLLIGFDLLHQIPSLRWSSKGLLHKQHFLTWTQVPHLFSVNPFDSLKAQIINECCAATHSEFLLKNPNPLWKNPVFFITLPFKKNEDVNPTKASHRGMNPEHLSLAKQELATLLSENLIEPTTSP
ncbi:hypothetical protein ACB092_01G052900 [Castanea dentata]